MNATLAAALLAASAGLAFGIYPAPRPLQSAALTVLGVVPGLLVSYYLLPPMPPATVGIVLLSLVGLYTLGVWWPKVRFEWPFATVTAGIVLGWMAGDVRSLMTALPALLVVLPAWWFVRRGWDLVVKVAASWILATAILAAALPLITTPGYAPDHTE